jgi:predicted RNA binding protein YcfA (HicA-like mRNA interferase family)
MTRLPRDLSGEALVRALSRLGFAPTRQTGSHMRLTTQEGGEHHVTVPLRVETLGGILAEVAAHFETSREDIIERLFG